jgi:hypothetical protein
MAQYFDSLDGSLQRHDDAKNATKQGASLQDKWNPLVADRLTACNNWAIIAEPLQGNHTITANGSFIWTSLGTRTLLLHYTTVIVSTRPA